LEKLSVVLATLLGAALVLVLFAFSGAYDVGADRPHTAAVAAFLNVVRERSIVRRAQAVQVPSLNDPARVREGAEHYSAMCVDCHLAPGITASEIRAGLMPAPPNLSREPIDPEVAFWAIKHGIRMTGMPAWGKTHDDEELWNIVSFVHQLPHMTASEYRAMTASTETEAHEGDHDDHNHDQDHDHDLDHVRERHEPAHDHEHEHKHE
jgi:mono/diheme cytochrome c family protein